MDAEKPRLPLGIVCGAFCIVIGLAQFLYAFLAFCSVILVNLLGMGLTLASSAVAAVPEEPYEIPYARALATTIAVAGMLFSGAAFFSGCHCFYRRHVSWIGCITCVAACTFLAALHFMSSLRFGGSAYVGAIAIFGSLLVGDWLIVRSIAFKTQNNTNPSMAEGEPTKVADGPSPFAG
jgi:hypothetical protein